MSETSTTISENVEFDTEDVYNSDLVPITQAVLKVHSRCNLNCTYCYEYNLGDQSYLKQPKFMSMDTIDAFGDQLADYLGPEPPIGFRVILHGGEPMLQTADFLQDTVQSLRRKVKKATAGITCLSFGMQTNGTLLTDEKLEVCKQNQIGICVSLDGTAASNDRNRVDLAGKPTHDKVVKGVLKMLENERYASLFEGFLSVIDIESDPVETYDHLRQFSPPSMGFLLPHGNWKDLPPGRTLDQDGYADGQGEYGVWLKTLYQRWKAKDEYGVQDSDVIRIEYFDSIIDIFSGGTGGTESLGGGASEGLVVIATDGTYEMVDTLKSTPGQLYKTGLSVHEKHSFRQASEVIHTRAQEIGATVLAEACKTCPFQKPCGGGYLPHRYSEENGFKNRTIFCVDNMRLISAIYASHVENRLLRKGVANLQASYEM